MSSWWGKVLGGTFGFMLGGPLGAAIGAAIGHNFDRGLNGMGQDRLAGVSSADQEQVQTAFFTATFSIMGYIAKADGKVSKEEINIARQIMDNMNLNAEMRKAAINLFEQGKSPNFPAHDIVEQLRKICGRRTNLIRMFMEIQLQAAYADGRMDPAEAHILQQICQWLRFPARSFQQLEAMVRASLYGQSSGHYQSGSQSGSRAQSADAMSLSDAYSMLGVKPENSHAEIKKAYRRLMGQHHPDKLIAKGLPEEMVKVATEKTRQIRQAYEQIKAAKDF